MPWELRIFFYVTECEEPEGRTVSKETKRAGALGKEERGDRPI